MGVFKIKWFQFSLFFVFSFLFTKSALAQDTGEISGYVYEFQTGEPILGATVQVLDTQLGAVTNQNGYFTIENVPTTAVTLKASYVGYESQLKYNIIVKSVGNVEERFELVETTTQLQAVTIQPNPFRKKEETPLSLQTLSAVEISTYPGGNNDIAKVVQSLPGVASSVGGFRNDVIIRGGAPNENVYYLDGVEIPNINHFATQGSAGGPVGLLNVSFFNNVSLSSSAFGAEYDNALSGVLQFDQRNGNNRDFRTNIRLSSSETALTFEGPLFKGKNEKSKTSFIVSVRRSYLQFLFQVIGLPFLPDYWDYQYKLTHKIDDYNDIYFTGVGSIDDFSINVPEDADAEQQAQLDQVPIIKQRTNTVGVTWKRRFKEVAGFMTTTISTNYLSNDFTRFEDNINQSNPIFRNNSTEQETKLRYNYNRFYNEWKVKAGFVVQQANYTNNTLDVVDNFNFDSDLSLVKYGLHAQVSRRFLKDRLGLSFGVRADANDFTEGGNDLLETLSPRISASYTLDEEQKWSLNASWGRYFKIPPYTVLGFQDNNQNFVNQNTTYIENDHTVLGIEYLPNRDSKFSIEGFYKKYRNYPVSITKGISLANLGGFEVLGNEPVVSVGLGRTYGLEFLYQKKLSKRTYAILAYTYFRSEFTGFDQDNYLPSAWDSRHLLTFTGGYQIGKNWEVSARMRYLGRTPFAEVDLEATNAQSTYPELLIDYSSFGQNRLDSFNQTDVRIDKKWNFKKFSLNVFLEIQNILGQQIPDTPSYGLERDADGNVIQPQNVVEIEQLDSSSPLPSIGVVVDF
jgi:hypothetical protein